MSISNQGLGSAEATVADASVSRPNPPSGPGCPGRLTLS
jgi:hypothetical protein